MAMGATKLLGDYENDPAFKEMTPLQRKFAIAYLTTLNAVEAWILINPETKDNRYEAQQLATKYLRNPTIRAFLGSQLKMKEEEMKLLADRTLEELAAVAFMDPGELLDENNKLIPLSKLPAHVRAAVSEVNVSESGKVSYKLAGKMRALDNMVKIARLYEDTVTVKMEPTTLTPEEKEQKVKALLEKAANRKQKDQP